MQYPWVSQAHQIFRIVLIIQWLVSIALAAYFGSWMEPLVIGTLILIVPLFISLKLPDEAISRHAVAIGVQLFTALHIQQTFGMTEMHFEVFALLAFMAYYRDWQVIATSTAVIAVHHILFFVLQANSSTIFIFEEGHVHFYILLIHAAFALLEGGVLIFMTKSTGREGRSAFLLSKNISTIMRDSKYLDLRAENLSQSKDLEEFDRLLAALRVLVNQSNELSENAVAITDKVQLSSIELASSSENSNKQVSNINHSIQEIVQAINSVSQLSEHADKLSSEVEKKTSDTAKSVKDSGKGIETLRDTLTVASKAIQALSEKCQNISAVMQSIKTVAEQTNLLALNAAIESARAGEHGRGFAVVADEVRQLAIKSKVSAEEIESITATLISSAANSVSQMNDCVNMVDNAVGSSSQNASVMQEVVCSISEVSTNIQQIAGAAKQQFSLSKNIEDAAQQLNGLSSSQTSHIGSVKQEIHSLHEMCVALLKQLNQFKI